MKTFLYLTLIFCCIHTNLFSQQAKVTRSLVPFIGSVNLSDVEDKYNAQVYNLEMPEPDGDAEQKNLVSAKKLISELFPRKKSAGANKTTAVSPPTISISYVADSNAGIPPDNYMAVSNQNKTISVINSTIAAHDAQTGQMILRKGLKTFSSIVGLSNIVNDYRFDPKVIYDPEADRFICVMLNGTDSHNWIVLAFSQKNDPTGRWNFYKLYGDYAADTTWFDYPAISITKNEFFLTGNKIKYNTSWQLGFQQTVIYQIRKQDGYDSSSLNIQLWENTAHNGENIRNLFPVKGGNNLKGPSQYFLSNRNFDVQNDTIFLVKIPDTIGSGNTTLAVTPLVSNINYGVPPNGRQPDTSVTLATNDGRILGAYTEGDEIQFVSTSVHPVSGSAAVYHGKISNITTTPSVEADLIAIDSLDFGYPNISYSGYYNTKKSSIISFNYTGANTYPGMAAIYYDGAQYSDPVFIKQGDSSIKQITGKVQRWGDYMGSQVQWNAIGTVWVEGIYGRKNKDYGNYMAKLASPNPNIVNNISQVLHNEKIYPNPAFEFIQFEFYLQKDGIISFALYDMQGRKTEEILQQNCMEGKNRIRFNIASLVPGVYFLKAQSTAGKEVMVKRFVKQ